MLQAFQKELSDYLGVPETNLALFNNGTLALVITPRTKAIVPVHVYGNARDVDRRYFYPLLTDFAPYVYAKYNVEIPVDEIADIKTLAGFYRYVSR